MKPNKLLFIFVLLGLTACSVQKTEPQGTVIETKPSAPPPTEPIESPPIVPVPPRVTAPDASQYSAQGLARIYPSQLHGSKVVSGEIYDIYGMTAAMTDLPLYARVEVFNPQTGRKAIVTVNDRLSNGNHLIQLSYLAADILGLQQNNTPVIVRGLPAQ
jgi:rare lipoprotein A (peptidoglycan hydrolase)